MFSIHFTQKLLQLMKKMQKPIDKAEMKGIILLFSQDLSSFDRKMQYYLHSSSINLKDEA